MDLKNCLAEIMTEKVKTLFMMLYGTQEDIVKNQQLRYIQAVKTFHELFPRHTEINIYSAPGRTEIGGNHTDHQRGVVLAGAVNLDTIGVVAFHKEGINIPADPD